MRNRMKAFAAAAVLGMGLMSGSANAAILVNNKVDAGTGDYAGMDIVRFFAGFDTASAEATQGATGIQSLKATVSTTGPGTLKVGFTTPSGFGQVNTANVYGTATTANVTDATARTATKSTDAATYEAFGSALGLRDPNKNGFSPQALQVSQDGVTFTAIGDPANGINNNKDTNQATFGSLKAFRVEGFLQNPANGTAADTAGKVAGFTDAPGQGALIGIAVVPHGQIVTLAGQVAADKGDTASFVSIANGPEPTGLALMGVVAGAGLIRRSRKA